jgi:hypothetical protein
MRISTRLVLTLLVLPAAAHAQFDMVKIVEVFAGPGPQYVMLQSYAAGQDQLTGHSLLVYDASGSLVQTNTFPSPDGIAGALNQAAILIGTSNVAGTFGITVDLDMPAPAMSATGGKVCWDATLVDCVAWGNYSGSSTGVGSAAVPGGIPSGKAIRRDLAILGGATILEATDDTNDSAADFDLVDPQPRNSLGQSGATTTTHIGATTTTGPTTTTAFGATTTVVPTTTTTTTLACAPFGITAAQCVLDAVPPAACASETLSRKLSNTIAAAGTLLDRALAAEGTPRGTRLIKKAAARLRKGSRLAAAAGTKGKLSSDCAMPLADLLTDARGRLLLNIAN